MFEGFEEFDIPVQDDLAVTIHGRKSSDSSLPPLLLLHGFPQSHHMWYQVAPQLVEKYHVIVPDLRGYGASSKPDPVMGYMKNAMANDFVSLMEKLDHDEFFVCAHDRGARVAHKMCVDHPEKVKKVILLDICPTLAMYEQTDFTFARAYFHWFFLIQPEPMPEAAITAEPDVFLKKFLGVSAEADLGLFSKENMEYYRKMLADRDTVHGMCQDYRAAASLDLEAQKTDLANRRKIKCPLRVLWGNEGLIEKKFDALKEWRKVTDEGVPVDGHAVDSGHFIPEHVPDVVVKNILEFLV